MDVVFDCACLRRSCSLGQQRVQIGIERVLAARSDRHRAGQPEWHCPPLAEAVASATMNMYEKKLDATAVSEKRKTGRISLESRL